MAFRNVNVGRGFELEKDLFTGLKQSIETNRPILAMEYIQGILLDMAQRLEALEEAPVAKKKAAPKSKTQTTVESANEGNESA